MINSNSPEVEIYWEKQELWRLCGLHTLNSIMQGPFFNEVWIVFSYNNEKKGRIIRNCPRIGQKRKKVNG